MSKKTVLILCLAIMFFLPMSVLASPFLCCDPMTAEVERIDIDLNGQLVNVNVPADVTIAGDGSWCLIDLATIASGNYTAKAMANYGAWGDSAWSADFLFTKPAIVGPVGIKVAVP